jgi:hypothetical protein
MLAVDVERRRGVRGSDRLYRHVTLVSPPPSLTTILACLQLSRNDPRIVHRCLQAIHHQLPSAQPDERERFLRVLPLLEECFYEIPGSAEDIWFEGRPSQPRPLTLWSSRRSPPRPRPFA